MIKNEMSADGADTVRIAGSGRNISMEVAAGELSEIIAAALKKAIPSIRVYVLESDITAAQDAVRTVVEQSRF